MSASLRRRGRVGATAVVGGAYPHASRVRLTRRGEILAAWLLAFVAAAGAWLLIGVAFVAIAHGWWPFYLLGVGAIAASPFLLTHRGLNK